jgi:hypothetical protein
MAYDVPRSTIAGIGESVGTVKTGKRSMIYLLTSPEDA